MKLIELESSLTPFICAHFRFVYVMRSAALNPPDHRVHLISCKNNMKDLTNYHTGVILKFSQITKSEHF